MIKYQLSDLAKDLNMQTKDIINMIKEQFNTVRKPSAILTEKELNFIFEKVTLDNSVPNFDKYFASKNAPVEGAKPTVSDKKDKNDKSDKQEKRQKNRQR